VKEKISRWVAQREQKEQKVVIARKAGKVIKKGRMTPIKGRRKITEEDGSEGSKGGED